MRKNDIFFANSKSICWECAHRNLLVESSILSVTVFNLKTWRSHFSQIEKSKRWECSHCIQLVERIILSVTILLFMVRKILLKKHCFCYLWISKKHWKTRGFSIKTQNKNHANQGSILADRPYHLTSKKLLVQLQLPFCLLCWLQTGLNISLLL